MIATDVIAADRIQRVAGRVPGVTVVIVGPGGIRARGSAGLADLTTNAPMSTDIAVPWFSMTKVATATLAVRLAEEGRFDLDEPIAASVSTVGLLRPDAWVRSITPRHLLQHTAGLANPLPVRWIHPAREPGPDPDQLLAVLLAQNPRLRAEPGSRVSYSNLGALVLAASMARRVGTPFETLMRRDILEPLGMTATSLGRVEGVAAATGYHPRMNGLRLLLPRWVIGTPVGRWTSLASFAVDGAAYGGLVGTADDAARFVQMHLADGALNGNRVISSDGAASMRRLDRFGDRYDLGLGWFRPAKDREADPPFVEHIGGGAGFHTLMRIYPTADVGVVVMGNATRYDSGAVAELALEYRG